MDALKKVGEEKKQAAKRLQEVEVDSQELTGENDISAEHAIKVESSTDEENSAPELFTETAQFSLEPLSVAEKSDETKESVIVDESVISTTDAPETFEETRKVIDLNDTMIIKDLSTEKASAPFDDTFHGVIFGDEQDTDVYEETLPGVAVDQLAKDLGGGQSQPTPVAEKTIFSAGKTNKKQSSFKWGVFIVLALLATGSFAIFYYFTITPVSRNLPSPLIARGIEFTNLVPPIILSTPEPDVVTGTIVSSIIEEAAVEIMEEKMEQQAAVSDVDTIKETKEPIEIVESIPELEFVVEIEETLVVDESLALTVDEKNLGEVLESLPENIQVDSSLITISKSKMLEKENAMVNQAFKAYQEGHYDVAAATYESVLKNEPDNRDAHLGLAAIAISKRDRSAAYFHYVHLLELNPADALAMNALISLSNSADPIKDESAIKLLIQREGDLPYLYFSLGNIYAKQKRWISAQQAFFNAYRLDMINSDYVLNLAISLDQIGQYDTALDFYKTAIELSRNSSTNFDPVPVNKRILTLSKLIKSTL